MALKRARKRAPGAGRKPRGDYSGKTDTFTTRITPQTRRALEQAAAASGRSLSQEVEYRLHLSLHKLSGKPHNRALGRAIAMLAERIERETQKDWRRDAYTGLALCSAVEMVLQHFAPASEGPPPIPPAIEMAAAKMPPDFAERYRKPAGFGHLRGFNFIGEIEHAPRLAEPASMIDEWTIWGLPGFPSVPPAGLGTIRRDLKDDKS
jgi:hypothetical protein